MFGNYKRFGTDDNEPLFCVTNKTAKMICADLKAAGLPYIDENGDIFDFHALRGQHATDLARTGVSLTVTSVQMRHKDPKLIKN